MDTQLYLLDNLAIITSDITSYSNHLADDILIECIRSCIDTTNSNSRQTLSYTKSSSGHIHTSSPSKASNTIDVINRKISFFTLIMLMNQWRRCSSSLIPQSLKQYFYQVRQFVYFSYEIQKETEYMLTEHLGQAWEDSPQNQPSTVLMYFVPRKFLGANKVFMFTKDDAQRVLENKDWKSLPDPKNCHCWFKMEPKNDGVQLEAAALTIFRRQNSKSGQRSSRQNGIIGKRTTPGPSVFCSYKQLTLSSFKFSSERNVQKEGSAFIRLKPQLSDEYTSDSTQKTHNMMNRHMEISPPMSSIDLSDHIAEDQDYNSPQFQSSAKPRGLKKTTSIGFVLKPEAVEETGKELPVSIAIPQESITKGQVLKKVVNYQLKIQKKNI